MEDNTKGIISPIKAESLILLYCLFLNFFCIKFFSVSISKSLARDFKVKSFGIFPASIR
jgi:hypothetical protein